MAKTERIQVFWASLTMHVIIFSQMKIFEKIIFQTIHLIKKDCIIKYPSFFKKKIGYQSSKKKKKKKKKKKIIQ